jgi:long-subunit fatty acid transport protein
MAFTWPWEAGDASGAVQASFQRVISFEGSRTIDETLSGTVTNRGTGQTSAREDRARRTVESTGGFDILSFGAGVRASRQLRIGITVNRWLRGYEQTILRREQIVPSRQESAMTISGWNAHLGAIFSPGESLNLGMVYKTGLTADVTLDRVRYDEFPPLAGMPARTNFNLYSRDDLRLVLPEAFGAGLSWRPRSNLTLSADYTRTNWSRSRIRNFFALPRANPTSPLEFPAPDPLDSRNFCGEYPPDRTPPNNPCPPAIPYPTLDTRNEQADTQQVRLGLEYVVLKRGLKWPLRVGYFRDGQLFRSLEGQAPVFDGFTLGTGLILGSLLLDVAYVYEAGRYTDRNIVVDAENGRILRGPGDNNIKSHKVYTSLIVRLARQR